MFNLLEDLSVELMGFLTITLPSNNPCLSVKNIQIDYIELKIHHNTTTEYLKPLLESNVGYKVIYIWIEGKQNIDVMDQLSVCTGNVKQLTVIIQKISRPG